MDRRKIREISRLDFVESLRKEEHRSLEHRSTCQHKVLLLRAIGISGFIKI
jgi:hypothetical protein